MRTYPMIVATMIAALTSTCAKPVPQPANVPPGTPHVSWIIMHGDRDNPDREFACQSHPRNECVVPVSRPDEQVFSHLHFYYHGAGAETKYTGPIQIGFFRGAAESSNLQANVTVQKTGSISNQSVTGIVTAAPGKYAVTFALVATSTETGKNQPIREEVPVVVR